MMQSELEIEPPIYQHIRWKCPVCGSDLDDDNKYHIWCTNTNCTYEEYITDEPLEIGEIY